MRDYGYLTPSNPKAFWTWPYNVEAVQVTNYTASPCYLRIGTNIYPDETNYDQLIPPGVSAVFPTRFISSFAASLSNPLDPAVSATAVTDRVDIIFVAGEALYPVSQNTIPRHVLQEWSFHVNAGGDTTKLLDGRYARSIQIACAPTTGTGNVGIDIEFGATPAGPFSPYISYRLPTSPTVARYLIRTIPVVGRYIRLHIYEVSTPPGGPVDGLVYFNETDDYLPNLDCFITTVGLRTQSLGVGGSFLYEWTHDSGVLEWVRIIITGIHTTFDYEFEILTDSTMLPGGLHVAYLLNLKQPFDPLYLYPQTQAHFRLFDPSGTSIQYLIPVNAHYNNKFGIYMRSFVDDAPPADFHLSWQFKSNG